MIVPEVVYYYTSNTRVLKRNIQWSRAVHGPDLDGQHERMTTRQRAAVTAAACCRRLSSGPDGEYERVLMTGMNALVQLPILMRKRDIARGLDTAGFITGYRGSPLGGYDQQLWRAAAELKAHRIEFVPGLNEEIAATSIWGTQQVSLQKDRKVDGVMGIWYGKGPGVDRSGDAIKHANMAGTSALGGVLCIAGDDHACKSSTLPHQSDLNLRDMNVPVFSPGSVSELLHYGIVALELSRYSGCWTALKVTSQTIDSTASIPVPRHDVHVSVPDTASHPLPPAGLNIQQPDDWNAQETRMYAHKLPAVAAFLQANRLDRIILGSSAQAKLVIVASGVSAWEVVEVLQELRIDEARARELMLAVLKVAVVWPLEAAGVCEHVAHCEEVLVVEEKRSLIEYQLKDLLYNLEGRRPRIVGKKDVDGARLLQEEGELAYTDIRRAILGSLARVYPEGSHGCELSTAAPAPAAAAGLKRLPYFCAGWYVDKDCFFVKGHVKGQFSLPPSLSIHRLFQTSPTGSLPPSLSLPTPLPPSLSWGSPHNSSTVVPEGSQAMGGIGCHTLALFMPGVCVCVYACVCVRARARTHTHTHTHTWRCLWQDAFLSSRTWAAREQTGSACHALWMRRMSSPTSGTAPTCTRQSWL